MPFSGCSRLDGFRHLRNPGKPPPEPISTQRVADGDSLNNCALSRIWRSQASASVEGATRLMLAFHLWKRRSKASSLANVSRETGPATSHSRR
jgi:hypothetical protein